MTSDHLAIFVSANRELGAFLARIDGLVHGKSDVSAEQLRLIGRFLESMGPEMTAASRDTSMNAELQSQVREYIQNLRALQSSLEQVQCVMLARRAKLDKAQRHVQGLQGWVSAYRQTT